MTKSELKQVERMAKIIFGDDWRLPRFIEALKREASSREQGRGPRYVVASPGVRV
jgi:hypothetical protein